jgi:hypothetical protein
LIFAISYDKIVDGVKDQDAARQFARYFKKYDLQGAAPVDHYGASPAR